VPTLGLVLDEQRDFDHLIEIDNFAFLVGSNVDYFEGYSVDGVTIEYQDRNNNAGFIINPIYNT